MKGIRKYLLMIHPKPANPLPLCPLSIHRPRTPPLAMIWYYSRWIPGDPETASLKSVFSLSRLVLSSRVDLLKRSLSRYSLSSRVDLTTCSVCRFSLSSIVDVLRRLLMASLLNLCSVASLLIRPEEAPACCSRWC